MQDDTADILAERTMPLIREKPGKWSGLSSTVKAAFVIACLLVVYMLVMRVREHVLRWRERSYKLAMRRRHGIPDYDHRPFNVAYADVVRARRTTEPLKKRSKPATPAPIGDGAQTLPKQNVRQRPGGQSSTPAFPGTYNSFVDNAFASTSGHDGNYSSRFPTAGQSSTGYPRTAQSSDVSPQKAGPSRRFSRKNISLNGDLDGKKRSIDEQEIDEHDAKKPKVDGDELIDGDEDAEWEEYRSDGPRGSKRGLGDEEENNEEVQSKRTRDKRPRKVSLEKPASGYQEMDIDGEEDDEVAELKDRSRGKKRDRAEAGSTFGGDESAPELDEDDLKAMRRRRKRRTVSKRKSDAGSVARGKKRDRDIEDVDSDLENDDEAALKSARKKRGKRASQTVHQEDDGGREGSDMSLDESLSSSKSRARQIGDEWESHGVKYKIGLNAQRLRQALVKKARHKFVMPKDSQHPDRNENLEVFVETWLTEEEYEDAKAHHLLAWQDSPKQSAEPDHLSLDTKQVPRTPASGGKNLLWGSTPSTPGGSPVSNSPSLNSSVGVPPGRQVAMRDPYRSSIAGTVGLRLNPFEQPQRVTTRRIASAARAMNIASNTAVSAGLSDSTNGSPRVFRTFSKWEKQDLEAKAMMKMREANKKKEAEKEAKLKEEHDQAEREKAEKERIAREKAEKEQKVKEAQDAAKLAVAKPADSQQLPQETKGLPSFSLTKPAATPVQPTGDAPKPSFFGPSLGALASGSTSAKPDDKATQKPPTFPPAAQSSTSTPSFFGGNISTAPVPSTSITFGGSAHSIPAAQKTEQPKPISAFGTPAASNAPAAAPLSGTTKPVFSFGPSASQAPSGEKKEEQPAAAPSSGGQSLLARMGAPNPFDQSKATSAPSQSQSTSGFSFAKPDAPKTSTPATQSSAPAPAAAPSSGLKFNFGPVGKSSTTPSQPVPTSSSLNGALGADASKTTASTPSSFGGFKAHAPPGEAKKDDKDAATTTTTAPKFSFGGPSSSSAFGTSSSGSSALGAPSSGSAFGGVPSSGSAFGTSSLGLTFGSSTSNNVFGSSSSGSTFSAKPAALASGAQSTDLTGKSAVSTFGNIGGSGTATGTAPPSTDAPAKSGFSFASTGGTTSPFSAAGQSKEPAKSAFSGLGNTGNNTQTASSPFGTSSAFGGGGASNIFGGSTNKPAEPAGSKPTFSFGTPTAPSTALSSNNTTETPKTGFSFGNSNAATTTPTTAPAASGGSGFSFKFDNASTTPQGSPFGAPAAGQSMFGKPSGGPSAFGFGPSSNTNSTTTPATPAGGFSFGSAPTGGQQQQ